MLLVVGLPNSGKSSLINALKRAAKARGGHWGTDQQLLQYCVTTKPRQTLLSCVC
jgi:ribosome biogenesis GTPase A